MRPCPVPACTGDRKDSQIACQFHWFQLPALLRNRLWDGYRNHKGSQKHLEAVGEAMRRLKEMR